MTDVVWTDAAIECIKKYNTMGLSRSQIAGELFKELGIKATRNAIIGKLARLGVASTRVRSKHNNVLRRPARKSVNYLHIINSEKVVVQRPMADPSDPIAMQNQALAIAAETAEHAAAPRHIPFLDREPWQCAFICSPDGGPVTVCGHKQTLIWRHTGQVPSIYCRAHHDHTHTGCFGKQLSAHSTEGRRRGRRAA